MMRRALLAALAAAAPVWLPADEPASVPLGLDEAVSRALLVSARLGELASLERAADAGRRGARAQRLPLLDLGASYYRNSDVPELAIISPGPPPSRLTVFPNIPDTYRAHAALSQPLYTGGRVSGSIDAAESQHQAAGLERETGVQDLVLETKTAFWGLVRARENERVLAEAVAAYESHLKDARNRLELGMAARNEVLAVQVERDRAELNRLSAHNSAELANADLVRLVDLAPGSRITPISEASAVLPPGSDVEALVAQATQARPELKALRSRRGALEANVKIARSDRLPQASLAGGYDYANPNPRILPLVAAWNGTWSVGVNIGISVFDGGRTSAAVAEAQARVEAVRHQLDDLERHVRLEVTGRRLDLETAIAALSVAQRNLEAAHENVKVAQDRYREGLIPSSELLDAETAQLAAGLDQTTAVSEVELAAARLNRSLGQ